jgi:hypothetical protein
MDPDAGGYPNPPEAGGHSGFLIFVAVVVLAAILAAGAALGMYLAQQNQAVQRAALRKAIYKSVRKALDRALQARGPELVIACRHLIKVATLHLGPLFAAGKPMSGPIDLINRALNGRITDAAKPAPPAPQPVTHAASTHAQEQGKTTVVTPSVITNINVTPNGHDGQGKPDAPPKPAERDMTVPEQLEELGKAVEALNRAWQADTVDAFLAAAQKALLDAKPIEEKDDHRDGHGR